MDIINLIQPLVPFEYHKRLRNHLKERKKTWDWFKANNVKSTQAEAFKTALLKNTYRLDKETNQPLYDTVDLVCQVLGLDANVTLYQEHNSVQLNASISVIERDVHIVFSGSVINLLSPDEIKALLAHELSHYLFHKIEDYEFEITERIIITLGNDPDSNNAIIETARIFQLYVELFCDSGALKVCENHEIVIQMLVKLDTGLQEVNAQSFLSQAKEIVDFDSSNTDNYTHPESYIRSLALAYQAEKNEESIAKISLLIEGKPDIDKLDVFMQQTLQNQTKSVVQLILKPSWMQTETIMNLSKQYFTDFYIKPDFDMADLLSYVEEITDSIKNYFSYILLDFAMVDTELEGASLGHTFEIAELLNINDIYEKTVRKELKLTVKSFKSMQENVLDALQNVKESKDDSIYNN